MCSPIWKLVSTHPPMRIDYTSPPQSTQATLGAAEPVPTTKILKKILKVTSTTKHKNTAKGTIIYTHRVYYLLLKLENNKV